ncbi:MAG: CDP-alcohol phosphatidyltransferase family protein [Pseudomonadota bacterium]|nr:CDP-alcohol phosphatidyltransferase family protein [Pseudomonadota bacterium]
MSANAPDPKPLFVALGDNPARAFAMAADVRAAALAFKAGMEPAAAPEAGRAAVLADLDFAWDPVWARAIAARPATALVKNGRAVLVHLPAGADAEPVAAAMRERRPLAAGGLTLLDADRSELSNHELRKRDRPFVLPLIEGQEETVERAAYDAAYKGVTDALTLYLWRRPAFYLTRWAARAGLSPNIITLVGALLCVAAFFLFWDGRYWAGCAAGFAFMVLDTVDGKLARCTGQSSKWGNVFDHGIDLVHPPFWWWAWAEGLGLHGPLLKQGYPGFEPVYEGLILAAIVGGYVVQRVIEGIFMRRYKMHIHVWRPVDSKFRLITARRNPNMVILVASLVAGRPDLGLQLVALWTLVSLIFHAVRLAMANARADRGRQIISWLS